MSSVIKAIAETNAYACLDCGKCTSVCPVSRYDSNFLPRMLVYNTIHQEESTIRQEGMLWSCITCSACETICPSGVKYTEMIKRLRQDSYDAGLAEKFSHGGTLQSMMHIMTSAELRQHRMGWLSKKHTISRNSDTLFFVGCSPYLDTYFDYLGVRINSIARGSITLLNSMGISPMIWMSR